jgi:hypothetical protein
MNYVLGTLDADGELDGYLDSHIRPREHDSVKWRLRLLQQWVLRDSYGASRSNSK